MYAFVFWPKIVLKNEILELILLTGVLFNVGSPIYVNA